MAYQGSWKIDDLLTFYANTQVFSTGVATDADAVPAYRVYEDETGTAILTGTMALLDSANTAGFYSEQITLSAANGFEKGKSYVIYISATVSSVAGATHHNFQIEAEVDANRVSSIEANVITATSIAADAITAAKVADGTIDANTFAAGAISAAAIATGAIDADALAADAGTEIGTAVWATATRTLTALDEDSTTIDIDAAVTVALATTTYAEPTGVPGATVSLAEKIGRVYQALRNQVTVTATKKTFFDDATGSIWEKDLSDDGTTYTETEGNAI